MSYNTHVYQLIGRNIMLTSENRYEYKLDSVSGAKLWLPMSTRNIICGLKPELWLLGTIKMVIHTCMLETQIRLIWIYCSEVKVVQSQF